MKVEKISDTRLKITDEVIRYVEKTDLENDKVTLGGRLSKINALLHVFNGAAASAIKKGK